MEIKRRFMLIMVIYSLILVGYIFFGGMRGVMSVRELRTAPFKFCRYSGHSQTCVTLNSGFNGEGWQLGWNEI
jgi:hypothetical protein